MLAALSYTGLINTYCLLLKVAHNEEVEVCRVGSVPDCDQAGEEECSLVYDTVCTNRRREHRVLEDVATCDTVLEEKCEGAEETKGTNSVNFVLKKGHEIPSMTHPIL